MITLTQPYTMPEEQLTATQQTALTSLILGNTVSEAAIEAGVHRNTVHRWLKTDEPFQAARHRAQRDARMAVEAKLHDTAMAAVDCLEKCLREGDAYVAEQLLKGLGCFDGKLKNLGKDEAVALALEALQHSATSEMFRGERAVGPALAGQLDSASAPDQMAASNHVSTDETSGQARTYEEENPQPIDSRQAQPDLREMERYASVFSKPDEADTMDENPQHDATSDEPDRPDNLSPKRERGMDCEPVSCASGRVLREEREPMEARESVQTAEVSGQARTYEVQHDATSNDVYTVEHDGETCDIHGYADLSTQQTVAMFALQTGQSIEEAADTAETEPATVTQWLRGDCTFQAAMNRCAGERRRSIQSRLAQLASRAADVIDLRVIQGNGRVAVKLLKGLGYLGAGV